MRKIKRLLYTLALLIMILGFSSKSMAASSDMYKKYVKTQMIPSIGKAVKGTKKVMQSSKDALGVWCKTKGILSVYTDDLNNDKKKEALVVYLKDSVNQYSGIFKDLHIAVLAKKNGKVVMTQDILVDDNIDNGIKADIRVYVKTYKKKKYVVIQDFFGIDGCGCSTFVLSMKSSGKLAVKKAVHDPGYTSAIGLYLLPLSGVRDQLTIQDYGKTLYSVDEYYGYASKIKDYGKRLNNELKNYGLKARVAKTYFNSEAWMLKKNSNMKLLCSIKETPKMINGEYIYTYVLSDNTNFK